MEAITKPAILGVSLDLEKHSYMRNPFKGGTMSSFLAFRCSFTGGQTLTIAKSFRWSLFGKGDLSPFSRAHVVAWSLGHDQWETTGMLHWVTKN